MVPASAAGAKTTKLTVGAAKALVARDEPVETCTQRARHGAAEALLEGLGPCPDYDPATGFKKIPIPRFVAYHVSLDNVDKSLTFTDESYLQRVLLRSAREEGQTLSPHVIVCNTVPGYTTVFIHESGAEALLQTLANVRLTFEKLHVTAESLTSRLITESTPAYAVATCRRLANEAGRLGTARVKGSSLPLAKRQQMAAAVLCTVDAIMEKVPANNAEASVSPGCPW